MCGQQSGVEMTQIGKGWGSGPSARYETLAAEFRPVFQRIRATAVERDLALSRSANAVPHGGG